MSKKLEKIIIYADIEGPIWMPHCLCTKEVKMVYTPNDQPFTRKWNGLRSALLDLTNDGDFRYANISWGKMEVIWSDGRHNYISRMAEIPFCKLTEDLFVQNA